MTDIVTSQTAPSDGHKPSAATDAAPKRIDVVAAIAMIIRRAAGIFEPLRVLVVNTLVILAVFVGGYAIYKLAAKTSFVVKDISVPASLQEQGITGNVIAQQILDHISEIDAAAGSRKQKAQISGLDFQSTMPTINLPVGGFNMGTIVSEVRRLLGYTETVITGEVFIEEPKDKEQPAKYGLRLRIAGDGPIYKSEAPEPDVQRLIAAAAERIMHKFDPINLGYFYYRQKDYDKAEETADFALASANADNYPWAYTMRGLIARDRGKVSEAARNFNQVVSIDPNFGMGHVNLSGILRLDGQLDAAEAAAHKAIDLMPNQHEGYAALALVLLDRGDRDKALAEMDKGVEVDPQEAQSHLAQGALRQSVERYEEAIASYQTSAKLRPSAAPLIGAANASTHLNRQDEALGFLQRATQAEPKSVDAWLALGAATRSSMTGRPRRRLSKRRRRWRRTCPLRSWSSRVYTPRRNTMRRPRRFMRSASGSSATTRSSSSAGRVSISTRARRTRRRTNWSRPRSRRCSTPRRSGTLRANSRRAANSRKRSPPIRRSSASMREWGRSSRLRSKSSRRGSSRRQSRGASFGDAAQRRAGLRRETHLVPARSDNRRRFGVDREVAIDGRLPDI